MENINTVAADKKEVTKETAPLTTPEGAAAIPSFAIQADSLFGIRSMIAIRNLGREMLPRDEQRAIEVKLREFDLYEETNSR